MPAVFVIAFHYEFINDAYEMHSQIDTCTICFDYDSVQEFVDPVSLGRSYCLMWDEQFEFLILHDMLYVT